MSWTQPCCDDCWFERNPGRKPVRLIAAEIETCVYCGEPTHDGLYVRIDPQLAPYPTNVKGD
jgi:hypothetical protein